MAKLASEQKATIKRKKTGVVENLTGGKVTSRSTPEISPSPVPRTASTDPSQLGNIDTGLNTLSGNILEQNINQPLSNEFNQVPFDGSGRVVEPVEKKGFLEQFKVAEGEPIPRLTFSQLVSFVPMSSSLKIGNTAVKTAAKIGGEGVIHGGTFTGGIETTFKSNTKTLKQTQAYLAKAWNSAKNPKVVGAAAVGALMGAIGTYPFAGFIKEEALQTLGFGMKQAIDNNDEAGFNEALELTNSILDPSFQDRIIGAIPYANVVKSLNDFFDAARIKVGIDQKIFEDRKEQISSGQSEEDYWKARDAEQKAQETAIIDYYNTERKKLLQWEAEARANEREANARFWAKEAAKQRALEEADRKAQAEFWQKYREAAQKAADDNRPSKLNFGLL